MEAFKAIYKILRFLEETMKVEEFPFDQFTAKTFKITEPFFTELLRLLVVDGYVKGIQMSSQYTYPYITLKGLEYLQENSMMKKAANIAKGTIDVVKS